MIGDAALVVVCIAAVCFAVRLAIGPTIPDRILALDGLLLCVVGAIAADIVRTGDTSFVMVMVIAAVVAFIGAAMVARFVERRGA